MARFQEKKIFLIIASGYSDTRDADIRVLRYFAVFSFGGDESMIIVSFKDHA